MKNKTDKHTLEESQKQGVTKQKLITEFTPSTGLRLWVPLHWEPIQLIPLKVVQNGSGINFSNCKTECWTKSLQDSSLWNYNLVFQKIKIQKCNREYSRL